MAASAAATLAANIDCRGVRSPTVVTAKADIRAMVAIVSIDAIVCTYSSEVRSTRSAIAARKAGKYGIIANATANRYAAYVFCSKIRSKRELTSTNEWVTRHVNKSNE